MSRLPYKAQYAKSGQSVCRLCFSRIPKNSLRIASTRYYDPQWFDFDCFWKGHSPKSISDIADVSFLEPEDQEDIFKNVEACVAGTVVPGRRAIKRPHPDDIILRDYGIEYAKSSTAECQVCLVKISKDEIRIKKVMNTNETQWHHVDCFGQIRGDLGFTSSADLLPGFKDLQLEDMKTLLRTLKPVTVFGIPEHKKKKSEGEESMVEMKENQLVKSQNDQFYQYKKHLSQISKDDLIKILEYNCQRVPNGQERMMNHLSDCLTFGSLSPCPKCGSQVRFDNRAYICTGQSPLCVYRARDPKRVATRIPLDVEKDYTFLASYSCKVQNRCLPNYERFVDSLVSEKTLEENDAIDVPFVVREKPRLQNMEFLVLGIMKRSREEIKMIVVKAGGKITKHLHDKLAAVIATKQMVEDMADEKMKMVKTLNVQVVAEDFLDEFMTVDPIQYIKTRSICNWGSDPQQRIRIPKCPYEKSMPKSMTMELKGGSAVDPDSRLQRVAHVYQENNVKYDAVLALTDIQSGRNSFYKLQLLQADTGNRFWLFRSWGRIGTSIGDTKIDEMPSLAAAKTSFEREYLEKTGNDWTERDMLVKWPGMFYPLEIDYGEKVKSLSDYCAIPSKLDPRVQNLVKLIFDINEMKKVMLAFELDMDKMPLGKLSQQQIKASYGVLNEISDLIGSNGSRMKFIEASNRFYTLIPHSFGVSVPPILNTLDQVCKKMDMLEALLEIDVAYNMLTSNGSVETSDVTNPIDLCYNQLKTDLVPLDKTDPEYASLETYARNTHAVTHNMYKLDIEAIYKVQRAGEAARYEPYKSLHNRRLLWHGSRLTNFVGILSHGLKIAPPEAPPTGAMFGKGLYFADMVSKSANYSVRPQGTHPTETGLMLLCEVALGNMKKCMAAEAIQSLPPNTHSTWGMGQTYPKPSESLTREDGVVVPLGRPVINRSLQSSLLYNEFIVYDVGQVNIKYLFQMKFNYRC